METNIKESLIELLGEEAVKIAEPMENHTTFRIGGPSDYFVEPTTVEQLAKVLSLCKENQISYYILGNGSNLLVGDKGYRGVMIHIGNNMAKYTVKEDGTVTAQTGVLLSKLAMDVANAGFKGFEFAAGIPGNLGGAVTMNAGAYGGEIKDCIVKATVMKEDGEVVTLSKEDLQLGYRTSIIQKEQLIVLEAEFQFEKGDKTAILEEINRLNTQRREKQPLNYPSAGSTFKRPEGYFAGKLIMDAGLRGFRVGGVQVSEKHCGFVVNDQNGTALDVRKLMEEVDRIVYEKEGVHLEPEVRFVGEF
ncbi:MAG: UDP-N-acetylmuramate dehydrogenase [Lachnospiraceae bacterium]|nr:UDP-N-acetylmuramate dehydrogenase [Lachnospiraceae bacterium]